MDTTPPSPNDDAPPTPPPYVPPAAGGEPPTVEGPAVADGAAPTDAIDSGDGRTKHPAKRTRIAVAAAAAGALVGLVGATAISAATDGSSGGDAVADREPAANGFPGGTLQDQDDQGQSEDQGQWGGQGYSDDGFEDQFEGRQFEGRGFPGEGYSDDGYSDDGSEGGEQEMPAPPQWGDSSGSGSAVPGGQSESGPSTRSGAS